MLKTKDKIFFLFLCISTFFSVSCSDVGFNKETVINEKSALNLKNHQESFLITPEVSPASDIVWVMDNSFSMKEEAQQIRLNFSRFIEVVRKETDLKLALISKKGGAPASLSLPVGLDPQRFLQVNTTVRSGDLLKVSVNELDLSLKDFFRPNSKKVFIFVSDDNAVNVLAKDFLKSFGTLYPETSMVVHSFVSLGSFESPCADHRGREFQTLSRQTGGSVFNVCDHDWSGHFEKLTEKIVSQSVNLDSGLKVYEVLSVKLDDEGLNSDLYSLDGNRLSVDNRIFIEGETHKLDVEYSYQ